MSAMLVSKLKTFCLLQKKNQPMLRRISLGTLSVLMFLSVISIDSAQQQGKQVSGWDLRPAPKAGPVAEPTSGTPKRIELSIEDSRPLAQAASELQDKFGTPISNEDIQ